MQLNVFSTDSDKSGFRLQYMEIYNWGTFDGHVWQIKPEGETSLLTGANGSGKTTYVDALLTLMVPERKHRFYNQSSGSEKKGDRTEESYVLGGFGSLHTENSTSGKTLYLRENREEAYSILLACFANEVGQEVTLFQVRYFGGSDMRRIYAIAHKALHIEADFTPFDLNGAWRRRIDQLYNKSSRRQVEWFDSAGRYAQRMVEVLGMQSLQALSLFNQTVGIKVLGNLDEFIRMHMLEPRNMEEQFQDLKKHLATLLDAQRNIEKAEAQIALLLPLQDHYASYQQQAAQLALAKQEVEIGTIWNSYTKYQLLGEALTNGQKALEELKLRLQQAREQVARLQDEERQIKNQIDQNKAGQRLQALTKDLEDARQKLSDTQIALDQFTEWCTNIHLEETNASDDAAYSRIKKEADKANKRLALETRNNEEDWYDARQQLKKAQDGIVTVENDLNMLLQSRNNIPGHLIHLRKDICQALKLETSELPFAGELMQVRPEDLEWQPVLEKLLHGFALRLLVPDKHYKKVTRYVNTTNLQARLVYYNVGELGMHQYAEDDTVWHKLDFHPDHKLSDWVSQQVIRMFEHSCVESDKELARYDNAITIHGLIKNRDRHEKDDRPDRNDPSRYVLGWNNEKKKEALTTKRLRLIAEAESAKEALDRADNKKKRLGKQLVSVQHIIDHNSFSLINIAGVQRAIRNIEEQINALKQSSNQLSELTGQLTAVQEQIMQQETDRDALLTKIGISENNLQQVETQQQHLQPLLQQLTEEDTLQLLDFQRRHDSVLLNIGLNNIDLVYQQIKNSLSEEVKQLEDALIKVGRELDRGINRIKNPPLETLQRFTDWTGDVQQLPSDREFVQEYMEWLEKLQSDNLPRYKKDFERYLHETMVYKIGELNEELESWEQKIKGSVNTLNQSLGGINFNRLPDTYIQLGMRSVPDTTIKEFRANLLNALPQAADWQQNSFEEKALHFRQHVQPLIGNLEESESYRSRVLDVRNWFEFWADEKYRNTDELKKTYRQMGQLSGGEKAQLTYTILCSAIAYQFGITKEGQNSRSLRFIAVDESFSNQDEEKATYLMELCRQLHLQLLVVTPSDKIQIVQRFIAHVHLVQRVNNRHSVMYNMTVKEFTGKKEEVMELQD
ncbi:hypothetical protein KTO58_23855 [Chitinophaga pendula]|uniref:ATP-binding protein n=1 Tax=Chitinophaga TaxID=79328 RepID=UPI000BB097FC|nr:MULTISPECIES: SbcC/MukB-like Walker B domain-containing protein [Chitinophaga]ASZ10366.1 hypothetical protein CK934_04910 [Chitinophaga sp. MD30]UCJ06668.1 hypothetical protein KTO58_23855 [Chitinophaga pendula]